MRPPSAIRDPHARLEEAVEGDPAIEAGVRRHVVSVVRQDRREALGTPVLYRAARVTVLRLYVKVLTADPDSLTLARLTAEMLRGMRVLGMTRAVRDLGPVGEYGPRRAGRHSEDVFTAPGTRRPSSAPAVEVGEDDDDGDDDREAGGGRGH